MGVLTGIMLNKKYLIPFALSTFVGVLTAVVILMAIDASLSRIPQTENKTSQRQGNSPTTGNVPTTALDYKAISERNLFRAKLEVEIPKPKSPKEIEEELLTAILRTMTLKGVMIGDPKKDHYAVIDRGGQKGVWIYETGEVVEKGLAVKEIRKDAVVLQKDDFGALLRLFAVSAERIPIGATPANAAPAPPDAAAKKKPAPPGMEIKRVGRTVVIPRKLAEELKTNNTTLMASIAVKVATDAKGQAAGYKVVAVDRNSIAGKMGLKANDTLQAINGYSLKSGDDVKKIYDDLKNATKFELKILRQGKQETISYEIR
jgi:type II secretion system protein C